MSDLPSFEEPVETNEGIDAAEIPDSSLETTQTEVDSLLDWDDASSSTDAPPPEPPPPPPPPEPDTTVHPHPNPEIEPGPEGQPMDPYGPEFGG